MSTQEIVAQNIRSIRKAKGITATFMARELGYKSVSSYLRLEQGNTAVTLYKGKKIADLLMVDINDFFYKQNLRESHNDFRAG